MSDEKRKVPDIPSAEQLKRELERVRYIKNFRRTMLSTVSSLTVVAAVAVIVSVLFLPVLRVTGTSMTPTMMNDELIICSKRSDFKSGDIVAFYLNNKILLKRVIGVAGDVIDIDGEGNVFVNGRELDEPYLNEKAKGECDIELPYQVPENRVFVMGDHRAVSIDSRSTSVGCIADEYIIGRVIFRLYPFGRAGRV
ncbi:MULTISPECIES: signal peptidase I [Ruminococcus]|jgi:signal peptidase I|uniref:Signal peptidase I n=1 Tax=Ruminococcus albus 8 TaxID=246199 RepID=E9SCR2_RUMAL|nr:MULTISPECIES: signal peptidase I [Ruminococcus]EGC02911.1 signal peptidase I [Ruminococcus albus 8]MBO5557160.1 signal peptidase I [Ruminococcus sp.]MBQ9541464.1 signal peptidase I [Ruminococcus sp.]MBR0529857.1 signal peptidase I [Ruminococcus sp.]MCC3352432.1 signal peptidase I [Ruminococcus albus 8]